MRILLHICNMFHLRYLPLLIVLIAARPASAQLYELPLSEIIHRSDVLVEGRVVSKHAFWDDARKNIYTRNTVEVITIFKGAAVATSVLQVITCGGIVDDQMELVSELVQFQVGDAGLFCLIPCSRALPGGPYWENYGSPHGFFQYDWQRNTVEHPFHPLNNIAAFRKQIQDFGLDAPVVIPGKALDTPPAANRMPPAITSFSPTSISAGTGSMLTINGTGFGSTSGSVRFINSNTGSNFTADASDIVSWNDTQIQIIVPSTVSGSGCAGTGPITVVDQGGATGVSASNLTVEFGYTNFTSSGIKYGAQLVALNNGGMLFTLSTTLCNSSNQDGVNAIGRALREWRCTSGVNWRLSTNTTSINAPASDGTSVITFDVGSPLPGGVLGVATSYYNGCFNSGNLYWRVAEIDINLKQSVNWYYCDIAVVPSGSFDFQTVVFHEFGHGHQLAHIVDPSATMHRSVGAGQARRTLNANEQSGADYVLGLPANPCGPGPMTLLGHPACLGLTPPSACNSAGACTLSLPVELVQFTGKTEASAILLEWTTATERNNHYFTLERSTDAVQFESVANVPGMGQSTTPQEYRYRDLEPLSGLNYYRLRQTDFDGKTALLGMIAVQARENLQHLRIFPNPVVGNLLHVALENPNTEQDWEMVVYNQVGQAVLRASSCFDGQACSLSVENLPPGAYFLTPIQPQTRQSLRPIFFIKL